MWWPFSKKEQEVPSNWDLQQAVDFAPFTPDIAIIQQKETQLLFVYDEMMDGYSEFSLIKEHSIKLGTVFTNDMFVMYKRKLGEDSYAIALDESFFQAQRGIIRGELYAVKSPRFAELDTVYQNGVEFERRRVSVKMPYYHFGWRTKFNSEGCKVPDGMFKEYRTVDIKCFMYVGIQEHWHQMMGEGEGFFLYERVRTFDPKNPDLKTYYHFSKLEYDDF